jgi:transcriptional regulator with XRE-family HTH domain
VGGEGVRVFDPAALVQVRRAVGWTQAQLADAVGAYKANVAAWETGRVRPSPGTVARIATALGVDPFRLTIGVRTPPLLADLRERRGWSQVELAGRIGVPRSSYSLLAPDDGGEPVVSVGGVEMVAEPGQVQCDLVGNLGGTDAADGRVEVAAGPRLDRVRRGQTADRQRDNLS